MILHLIFNSLIVFLALSFFVEVSLYLLNIKNARVRYIARTLPFFKVVFDIFFFQFFDDNLFVNLNPFGCQFYVYELIDKLFPARLPELINEESHIIIPQYIAAQLNENWLNYLTIIVVAIAVGGIIKKMSDLISAKLFLDKIVASAFPFTQPILNKNLAMDLENLNACLLTSQEIEIPFAARNNYIILPSKLQDTLTTEELEAVIAHELQHLKWKDPILKVACSFISALCWWIPTTFWLNKMIEEQEQGSDAGINQYEINSFDLATAVTKILHSAKNIPFESTAICLLGSSKSTHVNRIKYLLDYKVFASSNRFSHKERIVMGISGLAFFSMWMC